VIKRPKVGVISEYKPIPSVPICLVMIILKTKPSNFDRKPPVRSISVPIKKLFFSNFLIILKYILN